MQASKAIQEEATVFCEYLVGKQPSEHIQKLYAAVIGREARGPSERDTRILAYAVAHPRKIVYLDSALALMRPSAALRQRLYAMFAITEATPEYALQYLPSAKPTLYVVVIGLRGVQAICRAIVGMFMLRSAERAR